MVIRSRPGHVSNPRAPTHNDFGRLAAAAPRLTSEQRPFSTYRYHAEATRLNKRTTLLGGCYGD